MKKLLIITAIFAGVFAFASCSSNTPQGVAKKAISALEKGDYKAYAATFDLTESDQQWLAGLAEEKVDKQLKEKGGIKSYKVTDYKMNGEDKAVVTVHIVFNNGEEEDEHMSYVKKDGQWKQKMNK